MKGKFCIFYHGGKNTQRDGGTGGRREGGREEDTDLRFAFIFQTVSCSFDAGMVHLGNASCPGTTLKAPKTSSGMLELHSLEVHWYVDFQTTNS